MRFGHLTARPLSSRLTERARGPPQPPAVGPCASQYPRPRACVCYKDNHTERGSSYAECSPLPQMESGFRLQRFSSWEKRAWNMSAGPRNPLGIGLYPGAATFSSRDLGWVPASEAVPHLYNGNNNSLSLIELLKRLDATMHEKRLTLCLASVYFYPLFIYYSAVLQSRIPCVSQQAHRNEI